VVCEMQLGIFGYLWLLCLLLFSVCGVQVFGGGLGLFVFGVCVVSVLFWL
jgi:hypothetical protein